MAAFDVCRVAYGHSGVGRGQVTDADLGSSVQTRKRGLAPLGELLKVAIKLLHEGQMLLELLDSGGQKQRNTFSSLR